MNKYQEKLYHVENKYQENKYQENKFNKDKPITREKTVNNKSNQNQQNNINQSIEISSVENKKYELISIENYFKNKGSNEDNQTKVSVKNNVISLNSYNHHHTNINQHMSQNSPNIPRSKMGYSIKSKQSQIVKQATPTGKEQVTLQYVDQLKNLLKPQTIAPITEENWDLCQHNVEFDKCEKCMKQSNTENKKKNNKRQRNASEKLESPKMISLDYNNQHNKKFRNEKYISESMDQSNLNPLYTDLESKILSIQKERNEKLQKLSMNNDQNYNSQMNERLIMNLKEMNSTKSKQLTSKLLTNCMVNQNDTQFKKEISSKKLVQNFQMINKQRNGNDIFNTKNAKENIQNKEEQSEFVEGYGINLQESPNDKQSPNINKSKLKKSQEIKNQEKNWKDKDFLRENIFKKTDKNQQQIIDKKLAFLREEFDKRGWIDAEGKKEEPYFDFSQKLGKFNYVMFDKVKSSQILSTFKGMRIVTKKGMLKVLRNSFKYKNIDIEKFFPIEFDSDDKFDIDNFTQQQMSMDCIKQLMSQFQFISDYYLESILHLDTSENENQINLDTNIDQKYLDQLAFELKEKLNFKLIQFCVDLIDNHVFKGLNYKNEYQSQIMLTKNKITSELNPKSFNHITKFKKQFQDRNNVYELPSIDSSYSKIIFKLVKLIEQVKKMPQICLNKGFNKWIVKPQDRSRGIGITTHDDINSIIQEVSNEKEQYIIQKQIENPMLIKGRKFDLRVWTVITSAAPLIIWIQRKFQVRLSVNDFDIEDNDKFTNLTNWAVAKDSNSRRDECMLDQEQFKTFIIDFQGEDGFTRVENSIGNVISIVAFAGLDTLEPRPNTFEVLGWDLMVDEDLNTWMIECNRSPDLLPTTTITATATKEFFGNLASMFTEYDYKDVNYNDQLREIGNLQKLIDQKLSKQLFNEIKMLENQRKFRKQENIYFRGKDQSEKKEKENCKSQVDS